MCGEKRIKEDDTYCRCYESELPSANAGERTKAIEVGESIERYAASARESQNLTQAQFIKLLKGYGLDAHEVQLIRDYYYMGYTFKQIVDKRNWVSAGTASYSLRKVLAKLRKMGFTYEG